MNKLATKKQMIEFAEQNREFLNFLYMEGAGDKKKGYVEVMVDLKLEILSGGFVTANRGRRKFTDISKKKKELGATGTTKAYYKVLDSESSKNLCFFQRIIDN